MDDLAVRGQKNSTSSTLCTAFSRSSAENGYIQTIVIIRSLPCTSCIVSPAKIRSAVFRLCGTEKKIKAPNGSDGLFVRTNSLICHEFLSTARKHALVIALTLNFQTASSRQRLGWGDIRHLDHWQNFTCQPPYDGRIFNNNKAD